MQHEEQELVPAKGFGRNTNGAGILIVVIAAILLAIFCWDFWKEGSKETEHYRLNSSAPPEHGSGHGTQHSSGHNTEDSTGHKTEDSTGHKTEDSTEHKTKDSTGHKTEHGAEHETEHAAEH